MAGLAECSLELFGSLCALRVLRVKNKTLIARLPPIHFHIFIFAHFHITYLRKNQQQQ